MTQSIDFFEEQFRRQVAAKDFALNPFEKAVLPFVRGRVLDLGCGLGNLSVEAARRGAEVVAVDASPTAIERIRKAASDEGLRIEPVLAEIGSYTTEERFDTVVAIGLLMFFGREKALTLLSGVQERVATGGRAIVNVLVEGTTYMGMFEPGNYCLFGPEELRERFEGWKILLFARQSFDAPENTRKEFATIVAERQQKA